MNFKSFNNLAEDIKKSLYKIHLEDYDLVVGVPRSGMVPAYMIGLYLNLLVTDVEGFIKNQSLKKISVRKLKTLINRPHDASKVLLIDDSIISGNSLRKTLKRIPDELKNRITTLVIYSDSLKREDIDIYFEVLSVPRVFEWNIFHRSIIEKACVDIDGVLCFDPTDEQNDDGLKYINFLLNAKPKILPSYKIHSLVTSRLEKYRPQTEKWLRKHNILYENLIMLDLPSKESRLKLNAHAIHKAAYYKKMKSLEIFIESNGNQARQIMEITGKPSYSVDENFMYTAGILNLALKNPSTFMEQTKMSLAINMPSWLKLVIKPLYTFLFRKK